MNKGHKRIGVSALLISLLVPLYAEATNGYFLIGFGAKSRGMGGVGVAHGVDGLAAAFNPATMADVSTRFDIGGDFFSAPRAVTHSDGRLSETTIVERSTSEDTAFSHNDLFLIPNMGGVYQYSPDTTFGFAFIGAGAATNYNQTLPPGNTSYFFNFNGLGGNDRVGVKLLQMQIPLSVAYKIDHQHAVGASLVVAAQFFEAVGLGAFEALNLGSTQSYLTDQGTDHSYGGGIRLGWKGRFMENNLHVGVNYSSRVYMTEFDRYRNLFAEQGDFDIPENYAIGIAYKINPEVTVKADIQRINFSDIASVGNPGPDPSDEFEFNPLCPGPDSPECFLGGDKGMGFGWKDQTAYKLGVEYQYSNTIILRAGYNHGDVTVPNDQVLFNMLAPVTIEDHLTFGGTYVMGKDMEISASYVHGFENTVTGPTLFQPLGSDPALIVDNAALKMKQRSLGIELGLKF